MHKLERLVSWFIVCPTLVAALTSARATTIDDNVYTSYSLVGTPHYVDWLTCGSDHSGKACFGSGQIGPFGRVGCMIEGVPDYIGDSVTRAIYIVDVSTGTGGPGVTLFRYLKTDAIDPTTGNDSVSVVLTNTISLSAPLEGGANATCLMAGTGSFLFIGTDQTSTVLRVRKGPLTFITEIEGITGDKTQYITADEYGFVSVGYTNLASGTDYYVMYSPNGTYYAGGSGEEVILTPSSGYSNPPISP